ncbi:MAG: FAD-dependent oxidoreductase [Candidatus Levyibacteriota bacterium]
MTYHPYTIQDKQFETEGTYIYTLKPEKGEIFSFKPGQYVFIKDPAFSDPDETHPFSIASSPLHKDSLEFCIKIYGDWTQSLSEKEVGSELLVSEPQGTFVWENNLPYAVFLLGGIGISPIMSMLRTVVWENQTSEITILYGNRTPETIAYEKELRELSERLLKLKVVHVFSDISNDHPWDGYRGFLTKDILEKEVDFDRKPLFYFIGPPIFIDKMSILLQELHVNDTHIKTESLAEK